MQTGAEKQPKKKTTGNKQQNSSKEDIVIDPVAKEKQEEKVTKYNTAHFLLTAGRFFTGFSGNTSGAAFLVICPV